MSALKVRLKMGNKQGSAEVLNKVSQPSKALCATNLQVPIPDILSSIFKVQSLQLCTDL